MQNDSILIFLYEKLFPASSLQSNPPIKKVPTSQSVLNAGSQLTLLTQDGLAQANAANMLITESQKVLPGSRLNLNNYDSRKLEMIYSEASNYTRKSYGGNTQNRYRVSAQVPIDTRDKKDYLQHIQDSRNIQQSKSMRMFSGQIRGKGRSRKGMQSAAYKQFKEHQYLTTESNKGGLNQSGSQMIARPFSSVMPHRGKIDNSINSKGFTSQIQAHPTNPHITNIQNLNLSINFERKPEVAESNTNGIPSPEGKREK